MRSAFNWKLIVFLIGVFLCIESVFMFLAFLVALRYNEYDCPYLLASTLITVVAGILSMLAGYRYTTKMDKRVGILTITIVWLLFSLFGTLPFWLSGAIPSFTDAFFETMSGVTTTGASVLTNIEALPHGLLFWRSLTQWIGGMGFVLMSMAILPFLNGDMQLFSAEATGPIQDKLQPRIKATARRLWVLYVVLTLLAMGLLWLGGMSFFDALCHSLTTLSTGGYSTKQSSIAYWDSPFIQYVIIVFMFIGGTKFILLYLAMIKGKVKRLLQDEEFKCYALVVLLTTIIIAIIVACTTHVNTLSQCERTFRDSLFQVVSIITTTGFSTYDYQLWDKTVWIFILLLMFVGASSGSTSGGLKLSRIVILMKNSFYEFKRRLHPNAYLPIKMNEHVIPESVVNSIFSFLVIYTFMILIGLVSLLFMGLSPSEALSVSVSMLANVGPAFGDFGPSGTFLSLPAAAKWVSAFLMLIGRLELFTVLFLFSPSFWKR